MLNRYYRVVSVASTSKTCTQLLFRTVCGKAEKKQQSSIQNETKNIEAADYCLDQVRKYDRENYLAALHIENPSLKRANVALRAFNIELSLIRDVTSDSDRAKVRFHFWSRLVEEIVERDKNFTTNLSKDIAYYNFNPVSKELLDIFRLIDLDDDMIEKLRDMIGSRLSPKILGYKEFEDIDDLMAYCNKSNEPVYYLSVVFAVQVLSIYYVNYNYIDNVKSAVKLIGSAHGLSNVIRSIKYNSLKNCCYIPKDLLSKHNLTRKDFVGDSIDCNRIVPIVKELADNCQEILDESRKFIRFMPNYFRILLLPRIAIESNLRKLRRCNYNIGDPLVNARDNMLPLKMWLSSKYFKLPYG